MKQRSLTINNCIIGESSPAYVIAEIGHNHQGSVELCEKMIDAVINAGASAAKLQKRTNRKIYTKAFFDMPYLSPNAYGPTYGLHREALEFNRAQMEHLIAYARRKNFTLFASVFDESSADLIAEAGASAIKIASGDLMNTPLLMHAARLGLPMLVSTGGGELADVERAYDTIMPLNEQLCLLQCTSTYPPPTEELNLKVISTFRTRFQNTVIGFSDHAVDDMAALAAFTLGAQVIEKHFTLDTTMKGSDHAISLDPTTMEQMVQRLKVLSVALGDGVKRRYASEKRGLEKMAKALVAASELPVGHVVRSEDLLAKTPPNGLPPYEKVFFVGKRLRLPLKSDEAITHEHVEGAADNPLIIC